MGVGAAAASVVGRDRELAVVERTLEHALGGLRAVVLEGEAGIGKTAVWEAALACAAARSVRALVARPAEGEAALPFAALGDILEPLFPDALTPLPDPQRHALEAALVRRGAAPDAASEGAVGVAALAVLRAAAASAPLLVAVDDVQWLDRPSARALAYALRRLQEAPVAVVATRRVGEEPAAPELEQALPGAERVTLGPLSLDALGTLLRQQLGLELPRPRLRELHAAVGGNPMYGREVARASLRTGRDEFDVPPSLLELLRERIRAATPETRRLLVVLAALGEARDELLERLGVGEDAVSEGVARELVAVDGARLRFTHPLLAAAVRAETPPRALRRTHALLAERLEDPVERALHLAAATVDPDARTAATLEEASLAASLRGASDTGARLAHEAARLTPADTDAWARRTLSAAKQYVWAGDVARATAILEELLETLPPGPLRAEAALWLSDPHHRRLDDARALAEEGLRQPEVPAALRAQLALRLTSIEAHANRADAAAAWLGLAGAWARESGDSDTITHAVATESQFRFRRGEPWDPAALDAAVEARAGAQRWAGAVKVNLPEPRLIRLVLAIHRDDLPTARADALAELERSLAVGNEVGRATFHGLLTAVDLAEGDVAAAREHATVAVEAARVMGSPVWQLIGEHARLSVMAYAGDDGVLEEGAEAVAQAQAHGLREVELVTRNVLGSYALSAGDAAAAVAQLEELAAEVRDRWEREPGITLQRGLPDAIEAFIGVGRLDEAAELLASYEADAAAFDRAWARARTARCRALLLEARGDHAGALAAAEEALVQQERIAHPLERVRTLTVQGVLLRRLKRRREAREVLEQAVALADSLPARRWAERARRELERTGSRSDGSGLTPTERHVAELAARGMRNREIAGRLFTSEKTVEANLTRIYRKLGVRSRTELAAGLVPE